QEGADGADPDPAAGKCGLGQQDQHVEGVTVLGAGVGEVAVIGGIAGGGEQGAVEEDVPGVRVDLVLVPAAAGDLHDRDQRLVHAASVRTPPGSVVEDDHRLLVATHPARGRPALDETVQ